MAGGGHPSGIDFPCALNGSRARVGTPRPQALEQVAARQAQQMELLSKQLDEAKRQVQDIALKAIEGASGANALAHVNQIAIEQAKMRMGQG